MFIFLVTVIIFCIMLDAMLRKRSDRWKKLSKFPGEMQVPLLGNALQLGFDADDLTDKLLTIWKKHGRNNFYLSIASEDWIVVSNPGDIGVILNHTSELSKPVDRNAAMNSYFGDSVSSSEGEKWRATRKLMTPSFHFNTLEKGVNDANNYCSYLYEYLDQFDGQSPVNVYRYIKPYIFDILCNNLAGVDLKFINNIDHTYFKAGHNIVRIITDTYFFYWRNIYPLFLLTSSYREMMVSRKTIRDTSSNMIALRKEKLKQIESNNPDFDGDCLLDKLLKSRGPNHECIPDELINDEISLLCYSGHFTTSVTISHTLYLLAKYPEIQEKVLEEQMFVLNNNVTKGPTTQQINQMKYLEAVIKETLRVIPTVSKIGRRLNNDLQLKDGRVVPAGSTLIIFFKAMYQNPDIFPEPEKFNPDRFLSGTHLFTFLPFSAGPRNCVGFRYAWILIKTTLANLIRRYEILPGGPGTEPQFAYRLGTESKNGVQLKLIKRKGVV